jgi:putative membrane protein
MQINDVDIKSVEAAVIAAESKTSGEIVPVLVSRSTSSGSTSLLLYFILFSFALVCDDFAQIYFPHSYWYIVVIGALLWPFAILLSKLDGVQRLFLDADDIETQTRLRAELEFYRCHVDKTHNRAAILIFVSLFEHRAVVLADQKIAAKLPAETWQEVLEVLLAHVKNGQLAQGYVAAIEKSGAILAEHFPRQVGEKDELHNHLTIKD